MHSKSRNEKALLTDSFPLNRWSGSGDVRGGHLSVHRGPCVCTQRHCSTHIWFLQPNSTLTGATPTEIYGHKEQANEFFKSQLLIHEH